MNINSSLGELPKYLKVERRYETWYFHFVVFKYENEGWDNAYFAMYAKYNERAHTFNTSKVLMWAKHHTYEGAIKTLLDNYTASKGLIRGRSWSGKVISGLDLLNC